MVLYRGVCMSNLARMDKALKAGDFVRDGRYKVEELVRAPVGKKVYCA